jgi:aminotransferase
MATFGGTEGILHVMMSILNPGDEVIIADPSYPNYLGQIMLLGAKSCAGARLRRKFIQDAGC